MKIHLPIIFSSLILQPSTATYCFHLRAPQRPNSRTQSLAPAKFLKSNHMNSQIFECSIIRPTFHSESSSSIFSPAQVFYPSCYNSHNTQYHHSHSVSSAGQRLLGHGHLFFSQSTTMFKAQWSYEITEV